MCALTLPFSGRPLTHQHAGAQDLPGCGALSPAAKHFIDPGPLQRIVRRQGKTLAFQRRASLVDHDYSDNADCSLAKYQSQPRICTTTAKACTHRFLMKIAAIAVAIVIGMMTTFCAGHWMALPP